MKKQHFRIRPLTTRHIDQYNRLLRYAFQITEKNLMEHGWENEEIRKSKFPVLENAHVLGCFAGEELVSQFAVYPMEMNIHSVRCPVGFITSVATYPEYSGMKLMSSLMKQSLVWMRNNKKSLALLFPYSIPLYRHRGWEIVCDKMTWRIRDTQLPEQHPTPGYVRRVADNSPDLLALHTRFAWKTHGCLFRDGLAWEEYWRWDVDDTTVAIYYSGNDEPLGYVVYLINDDVMRIKEMIHLNNEARNGLLNYISAHKPMVEEVRGANYTGVPIAFNLYDSEITETIRPYIMGRIVDVEQFLACCSFQPRAQDVTLALEVNDPFLEWNNRKFTLRIRNGKGELTDAAATEHTARMSIGTLTTLLLGYKRAPELAESEHLQANAQTLSILDDAIFPKKPYISDYI